MSRKFFPHRIYLPFGLDSVDVAVNTLKLGAFDYIVKDQMALKKLTDKITKIVYNIL